MLQAGEILFVPAGCPHHVKNMEISLAVSANYVDMSNLDRVKNELQLDSLVDPRAGELLTELQSDKSCAHDLCEEQTMFSCEQFKRWPRDL